MGVPPSRGRESRTGRVGGIWYNGGMKTKTLLSAAATVALSVAVEAIDVSSASMTVSLDEKAKGAIARIVSAQGQELGAFDARTSLFSLNVCRTDDYTKAVSVDSAAATSFKAEKTADGARLTYDFAEGAVAQVVCTVRAAAGDGMVRWGIRTTAREGWAVTETTYPRVPLALKLGTSGDDDAFVLGMAKGGVHRNPGAKNAGWRVEGREPGNLVAQFECLYDDRGGFYLAAEDAQGHTKRIGVSRAADALVMHVQRVGFATADEQTYDVTTAAFQGADGTPTTWHDAADIYKRWALRQPWCATPFKNRKDIPGWMRDAPAMVRFSRNWLEKPDDIRAWMNNYWLKEFPAAPLVMAYWG